MSEVGCRKYMVGRVSAGLFARSYGEVVNVGQLLAKLRSNLAMSLKLESCSICHFEVASVDEAVTSLSPSRRGITACIFHVASTARTAGQSNNA